MAEPLPALDRLPLPDRSSILIVPLGGTNRVGLNCTLVGFDHRWIMIDAGATFAGADDERAGALAERHGGKLQQIIPDFRILSRIWPRIEALVLTHAHEDHVGALTPMHRYMALWPQLARVPVYATPYTRSIAQAKIVEAGPPVQMRSMLFNRPHRIGPFDVIPVRVTHSAPETCALAIRTDIGTVVFASDAKLDPDPVLGPLTDLAALGSLGAAGVLAFLGDSTNAAHDGHSRSEGEARDGIARLMRTHPGRVAVSTFSSNLARVVGVTSAARSSRRMIGASGHSIIRNVEAGMASGVLPRHGIGLVEPRLVAQQPPRGAALICTGTQGELNSSLRRMANDLELGRRPRGFALEAGDLLIHSARVIPGNELTVKAMLDTFRSSGVHVVEANEDITIHASGHARRGELEEFYRILRPRYAVPVHGDRDLIAAHLDLARSMGTIREALSPQEGEVLRIAPGGPSLLGRIAVSQLAVIELDGHRSGAGKIVNWTEAGTEVAVQPALRSLPGRSQLPGRSVHRNPSRTWPIHSRI